MSLLRFMRLASSRRGQQASTRPFSTDYRFLMYDNTKGSNRVRRTKIGATIGPATNNDEMLRQLLLKGTDCFRLNFQYFRRDEVISLASRIRTISRSLGRPVAILGDLAGSRIRLCKVGRDIPLVTGTRVLLTTEGTESTSKQLCVSRELNNFRKGQQIFLNDHQIELRLGGFEDQPNPFSVVAEVVKGGTIPYYRRGIHIPDEKAESLTENDLNDVDTAIEAELDFIALSFVESRAHVKGFKKVLSERGTKMEVIAKIETRSGFNRVDEIAEEAFGVLISRGELALEMTIEDIAFAQKRIITICRTRGKPCITATQVLESMTDCSKPTRAEATDVANAILDGTDAVMLATETALGQYPLEAVGTLDDIAAKTDAWMTELARPNSIRHPKSSADIWKEAFCDAAVSLSGNATNIIVFSSSGEIPRLVSRCRPAARVVAVTECPSLINKMQLVWGVYCVDTSNLPRHWSSVRHALIADGCVKTGDDVVVLDVENENESESATTLSLREVESFSLV